MTPPPTLPARLRATTVVLRELAAQRRFPYLPEREIQERRDARVREIVRYAAETVPFYRDLFRSGGFDPREIRTAEGLETLPLVEKEDLRADPTRFLSTSPRARGAVAYWTVGTTGVPVKVWHDRESLLQNIGFGERERVVESRFAGKRLRYTILSISTMDGTGGQTRSFYRRAAILPVRPARSAVLLSEPLEQVVAEINRVRPEVIRSFGSFLEALFRTVTARGIDMHLPKVLVYGGDLMTPAARRFIEDEVGIPVISRYNCVESFKAGFFCEERWAFHLHDDLCHVRIADERGRTLPDGARGEVVISNLVNHGTVLLNYRLADLAAVETSPCACGRSLRLLSELYGRANDVVYLADGTFVPPGAVWDVVSTRPEIVRSQLVQHDRERFELRLVTDGRDAYDRVTPGLVDDLGRLLHGAAVEAAYHELPTEGQFSKFKRVVALPPPSARSRGSGSSRPRDR